MIALVEGAQRQKTPNEVALNILLASLTIVFLLATVTLQPLAIYSGAAPGRDRAGRAAGLPHPHHDRRAAVGDRHRGHGPAGAAQRAGDVGPGRRSGRRRQHAAAGQDRHDHLGQPGSRRVSACPRGHRGAARRRRADHEPGRRDPRRPFDRRAGEGALRAPRPRPSGRRVHPVHRPDQDERRRRGRSPAAQGGGRLRAGVGRGAGRGRCPKRSTRSWPGIAVQGGTPLTVAENGSVAGRDLPQGHREGRHAPAVRRASTHGHPHA